MANNNSAIIPEVWAAEALLALNNGMVASPTVTAPMESEYEDGDTIHFPVFANFTVRDANDNGTDNTLDNRTTSVVDLVIDKHKYAGAHYGKKELKQIQANLDYQSKEQEQMGRDLIDQLELDLYNKMVAEATGASQGSAGTAISKSTILALGQAMDAAKVPATDRWLWVGAKGKGDILAISEFTERQKAGEYADALLRMSQYAQGYLGEWFGINIIWSTTVPAASGSPAASTGIAYHSNAVGQAIQQMIDVNVDYRARMIGADMLADIIYGNKVLRPTHVFPVIH